jgi:uncharacterized protein
MSAEELNGAPQNGVSQNGAADSFMEDALGEDAMTEDEARLIELVGFLVQGVVTHPEDVEVEEFLDDIGSVYGVRVHPDDVGRVIGREGRVANALRHLVKAAATKTGARVAVEIITDDQPIEVADSDDASTQNGENGDSSTQIDAGHGAV